MKALLWCFLLAAAPAEAFIRPEAPSLVRHKHSSNFRTQDQLVLQMSLSFEEQYVDNDTLPPTNPNDHVVTPNQAVVLTKPNLDLDAIVNVSIMGGTAVLLLAYLFSFNAGIWHGWTMEEVLTRIPIDAWSKYSGKLAENPITTKACTSATVYTIGDVIAQRTEGVPVGELDRSRILRSLAAGLIGHGPLSHFWYEICDGFFDNVLMWTAWWVFLPKVIVDQLLWGPFWNNTYILMLGIMKGEGLKDIWEDVKRTTVPLVVSGLKLWPAAHLVTYGLVPVENRLLWVDLVEILWVTILATQASGAKVEETLVGTKGNEPMYQ